MGCQSIHIYLHWKRLYITAYSTLWVIFIQSSSNLNTAKQPIQNYQHLDATFLSFSCFQASLSVMKQVIAQETSIQPQKPHSRLQPLCHESTPSSSQNACSESNVPAQIKGSTIDVNIVLEVVHERAGNGSITSVPSIENLYYPDLLNSSQKIYIAQFKVTSGSQAVQNVLPMLHYPKFNVAKVKARVEVLKQCWETAKQLQVRMLRIFHWERMN